MMLQAARNGAFVGAIVAALVLLLVFVPVLARGYPLALLPLLAAGPLAVRRGSQRLDALLLRGFVAGLAAALVAVGTLVFAVERLGARFWALSGALSYPPMPPLPRLDLLPVVDWPHEVILVFLPLLSALLAVVYGRLLDPATAGPARWLEDRLVSARASIETKLVGLLLLLTLFALVLGWVGFSALEDIHLGGHRLQLLSDWISHTNELGDEIDRSIEIMVIPDPAAREAALVEWRTSVGRTLEHLEQSPAHRGIAVAPAAARAFGATYRPQVQEVRAALDVLFEAVAATPIADPTQRWTARDARLVAQRAQFALAKRLQTDMRASLDQVDLQHHASLMALMALVVVSALAGILLGQAAAASITRPIGMMGSHLGRIAHGDFSRRLAVRNRDELGELTERLNTMTAELEKLYAAERDERRRAEALNEQLLAKNQELERTQNELELAKNVLEITVEERTAALRATNEQLVEEIADRERAQEALRLAHDHLEARVQQRTEELANINIALESEIAERKRAEKERTRLLALEQAARQRLEESNRALERATQAKSEFLATMSHEFRTPLNSIIGFSELLLDSPPSESTADQWHRFAGNIFESGTHLLHLVNDILDLSKVEAGRMELYLATFEVAQSLHGVEAGIQPLVEKKRLNLQTFVAPNVTTVYADEGKFKQVLYNLLSNAVKFTPEEGRVEVSARIVDDALEIAVADTGIGIAPEDQERIFEAFQQLDGSAARRHQGTGLGLALTRRLVELQGGRITVESAPGKGSRFRFTMPLRVTPFIAPPSALADPNRRVAEAPTAPTRSLPPVDRAAEPRDSSPAPDDRPRSTGADGAVSQARRN